VTTPGRPRDECQSNDKDVVGGEIDTASGSTVASPQRLEVAAMDDRLIHPMFPKSSRAAPQSGPSAAALAVLLAALLVLALLLPSVGRVGVDSPDQPLRPPAGFGL
jgi:hypothetical protein